MIQWRFKLVLFLTVLYWAQASRLSASTTNTSKTNPVSSETNTDLIATAEIAARSESDLSDLRAIESESGSDLGVKAVEQQLPSISEEVGARSEENARILAHSTSLELFGHLENSWQGLSDELGEWVKGLTRHATQLEDQLAHIEKIGHAWQATRAAQKSVETPPELLRRVELILTETKKVHEAVGAQLGRTLTLQNKVTEQQTRVREDIGAIDQARRQIMRHLFVRDTPFIWNSEIRASSPQALTTQSQSSLLRQRKELRSYTARKLERFVVQAVLFVGLAFLLTRAHRKLCVLSLTNESLEATACALGAPVASAFLIALLASPWIYSQAPRLLWSILGTIALIPALLVLRRSVNPGLRGTLTLLACLYLIDQLRIVAASQPTLWRLLFLSELAAALVYCLILIARASFGANSTQRFSAAFRAASRVAAALLGFSLIANIIGYGRLSSLVGNVTLSAAYLALALYAAIRVSQALIEVLIAVRPLSELAIVKGHSNLISSWAERALQWVAFGAWAVYVLERLSVRRSVADSIQAISKTQIAIGSLSFTAGHAVLFAMVLWAAFLVSRLLRFILEEEIFPHVQMAPGLHYSISKTLHYIVLTAGFFIALGIVGFNFTKLTILAGAVGVGLGFGMQNIVNNFVSGIILLFERPVKVGDVIQLENTEGVVKRIGIRASIVRTSNGSEIIVPNAKLISDPVTNWTFSQRRRLISMPISVASEIEPKRVMDVLRRIAGGHPLVAKDGPVQTLLTNLNNGTANYELRAWTDQSENWEQVRSDLFILVKASLANEGIPMR